MNKRFFSVTAIAGIVSLLFIFSACKKTHDTVTRTPAAGLLAINLSIDKTVGVAVDGSSIFNTGLGYTNYNGGYQGIYTGSRLVTSFDFTLGTTLDTSRVAFTDSAYYSLFVVGAKGTYKNVLVNDNLGSLPTTTGQAFVRYINAIPDSTGSPAVTVSANGTNIFNDYPLFATVSSFKQVTPGDVAITVNNSASATSASRTITVEQNKIYTILLTGQPGQTDSTKTVQIIYLNNGTLTP